MLATTSSGGGDQIRKCNGNNGAVDTQYVAVRLHNDLLSRMNRSTLSFWQTTKDAAFHKLDSITVGRDGTFTVTVEPASVYTVSTTTGQRKGGFEHPPAPSAPFPMPYGDTFDASPAERLPRFFADQAGSFQTMPAGGERSGMSVWQRATKRPCDRGAGCHGTLASWNLKEPLTIIGDPTFSLDSSIAVDARIPGMAFEAVAVVSRSLGQRVPSATTDSVDVGIGVGGQVQRHNSTWIYKADAAVVGGTVHEGNYSLIDAQAQCEADIRCNAITFNDDGDPDPLIPTFMWLTSKTQTRQHTNWSTYVLTSRRAMSPLE
eukprot:SAG31_NODE_10735_length_1104_cov_1.162189_1_plen_317_part_01